MDWLADILKNHDIENSRCAGVRNIRHHVRWANSRPQWSAETSVRVRSLSIRSNSVHRLPSLVLEPGCSMAPDKNEHAGCGLGSC